MSNTSDVWSADSPFTDGQIFVGAAEFGSPTLALSGNLSSAGEGLVILTTPVSATTDLFKSIDQILKTGQLASQGQGFQAFGTKGPPPVPGPSSVAGTSGPRAIFGHPPVLKAALATVTGGIPGTLPKGIQITSMDVIYTVLGATATTISAGLTKTKFGAPGAGAVVPVVVNYIAFGVNGLPVAVTANPVTTRIPVAAPAFDIDPESSIIVHVRTVNPAACTVAFYGVNLNINYNYS